MSWLRWALSAARLRLSWSRQLTRVVTRSSGVRNARLSGSASPNGGFIPAALAISAMRLASERGKAV